MLKICPTFSIFSQKLQEVSLNEIIHIFKNTRHMKDDLCMATDLHCKSTTAHTEPRKKLRHTLAQVIHELKFLNQSQKKKFCIKVPNLQPHIK